MSKLEELQADLEELAIFKKMLINNLNHFSGMEIFHFNVDRLREQLREQIRTCEHRMYNCVIMIIRESCKASTSINDNRT